MKFKKFAKWNRMEDYGETEPVAGFGGKGEDVGPTMPIGGGNGFGFEETQDLDGADSFYDPFPGQEFEGEETLHSNKNIQGVDNYDDVTMAANPGDVEGFAPVVGWLVCIAGADKGNDYRIRVGYNQIGRGENMDICIRGDRKVTRERHAMVAYDDREKLFFFGPSEGRNIVRLNNKLVMVPEQLKPYDILTVGESQLIFVPLCGEHFSWED